MPQHLFLSFGLAQIVAVAAIVTGLCILAAAKGTPTHRKWGRVFAMLASVAVCAGVIRFPSMLSVVSLLVLYQLLSGWHLVYTRANGPNMMDLALLLCAAPATLLFLPAVLSDLGSNELLVPWLFYASSGWMGFVLAYDTARWFFPRRWHAALWRYEHIARMNMALFGMLSALALGTRLFHVPFVLGGLWAAGLVVILGFAWRLSRTPAGPAADVRGA
jgi:hypothetical protein